MNVLRKQCRWNLENERQTTSDASETMEQQKLTHCQWEWKMVKLLWRTVLQLSYKTKYTLIIRSNNCAPWYVLIELKQCVHKIICRQMFLAALFIIGNTWKQIRCPSVAEWTNSGTSRQWNFTQHWKEMNYDVTKKTWRNLFGGEKKKANLKIYDLTYTNLEKAKLFPRTQSFGFQDHLVESPLLTCYKKTIFSPP